MKDFSNSERNEIIIDLNKLKKTSSMLEEEELLENSAEQWGGDFTILMQRMFGQNGLPVTVTGSANDVHQFTNIARNEFEFIKMVKLYGLDDPKTWAKKGELRNAVAQFQRETGIRFPFKV